MYGFEGWMTVWWLFKQTDSPEDIYYHLRHRQARSLFIQLEYGWIARLYPPPLHVCVCVCRCISVHVYVSAGITHALIYKRVLRATITVCVGLCYLVSGFSTTSFPDGIYSYTHVYTIYMCRCMRETAIKQIRLRWSD